MAGASHICDAAAAVKYACEHEFYRHAVVSEDQFLETALRRRIGLGTLEDIKAEAVRQGVLFKDGLATTERQRQEEREMCAIAREDAANAGRWRQDRLTCGSWLGNRRAKPFSRAASRRAAFEGW